MGDAARKLPEELDDLQSAMEPSFTAEKLRAILEGLRRMSDHDIELPAVRTAGEYRADAERISHILQGLNYCSSLMLQSARAQGDRDLARGLEVFLPRACERLRVSRAIVALILKDADTIGTETAEIVAKAREVLRRRADEFASKLPPDEREDWDSAEMAPPGELEAWLGEV